VITRKYIVEYNTKDNESEWFSCQKDNLNYLIKELKIYHEKTINTNNVSYFMNIVKNGYSPIIIKPSFYCLYDFDIYDFPTDDIRKDFYKAIKNGDSLEEYNKYLSMFIV
jgi:hypothetical protein